MDQYDAPKQHTPSGGLHYKFYVDGEKAKRIGSKTCLSIMESSTIWMLSLEMFCAIVNQAGYPNMVNPNGRSLFQLIFGIPKLTDILFNMVCKPEPQAPTKNKTKAPYDNNMV